MKKLNEEEIKRVAGMLSMTEQMAQEVVDVFADILENEQHGKRGWKIHLPLEGADDYIREWEDHWHRESSWQDFYDDEKTNWFYEYENPEEIFETIDTFKEYVKLFGFAYELSCNGMIIVVC